MNSPSFEEIFSVMATASVGNLSSRIEVPNSPDLSDPATKLAIALNLLLDDLALRKGQAEANFFQLLFFNHPVPMWIYDLGTLAFMEVNEAAVEKYGYTREEFLAMTLKDIRPIEDVPLLLKNVNQIRTALQHTGGWRHRFKNGTIIDVEIISHTLEYQARKAALVMAQDVTDRKRAKKKVQLQLDHLKALTEIDRSISSSFDLKISLGTLVNKVIERLGVDAADVLLLDGGSLMLEFSVGQGFQSPDIAKAKLQLGEGTAGRAAIDRKIVHIADLREVSNEAAFRELIQKEGFSSYYGVPLIAKGKVNGVLEIYHRSKLNPDQEWLTFLNTLAGQAAIAIDNALLFDGLQRSNSELSLAYDATIEGWSRALDLRDKETEGHTQRVTALTMTLAINLGLSGEDLKFVRWGSLLHDIGKLGVSDRILLKPGPLSNAEWVEMKRHPVFAFDMLRPIRYLKSAIDIPYCHHEAWDGTGYPRSLRDMQIPLSARIFSVADVFDALTSDRPYRNAWTKERALEHIRSQSGIQFDPNVVIAFLDIKSKENE